MKRKIGLIFCVILFFSPLFSAFGDNLNNPTQGESVDEISSESEPAHPSSIPNSAINEVIDLIRQLEREILLTNEMLNLREEDKAKSVEEAKPAVAPPAAKSEAPAKSFSSPKEEALYLMQQFDKEITMTNEILYPERKKSEVELDMLPPEGEEGSIGRVENPEITESIGPSGEATTDKILTQPTLEKQQNVPPREDWSQIPAPSAQEYAGKKSKSQKSAVHNYSQSDLESKNYSITIEKEQVAIISIPGLLRFLVTDPHVIEVSRQGDQQIAIKGANLGESFLHVWDSGGRRTIRIKVIQKGADMFLEIKQRLLEAEKMDSFKVRYSFDRYRLNSKSDNADRSYHYTDWVHRLGVTGETPWGMLDSKFQYEGKGYREDDFDSDLSAWQTSLTGPDLEVATGDVGAYFSEITLPPTSYQGFRFKNPNSKDINYDMMWGVRGSRMWGMKVNDFKGRNYFYGAKFGIKPTDFMNLRTIVMRSQGNDHETSEVVAGVGNGLTFFDGAVKLDGEYARGQHGDAFRTELDLKSDEYKFDFTGIGRYIDSAYQLVSDQDVPYRGERGYYLKLNYYPVKFFRYTGQYNRFRNKYLPNVEKPYKSNYDITSTFDVNLTDSTRLSWSIWDMNRLGLSSPTKSYGQSVNLQQTFDFFKNNTSIFALYMPGTYKSPDAAASSYTERRLTVGMRMNVFKNLYLDLSELWHYRQMLETRDSGTSSSMNMGVSYSSQIFNTPFYTSLAWRY
ncbi:MAG: pilus assembly protein N-terminal domain-containing protein, partial [Candidatus Omnitrophica bacterium]|nr:pilus assembly protein N-terminal domain-containing protein [Candidatus Omnitrophota bacterium]